ncbi:lysozyme inhibitor LprI family protein [Verrucomicrobiota bacterium sgz303538]
MRDTLGHSPRALGMTMKAVSLLSIVLALMLAPAQSQSMMEMKHDAQRDFEKADAELNAVYKKVIEQLGPKGAAALKEAQRAWVIFRDKTAEAYGKSEEGGSLEGLMYIRCQEAITQNRTKELRKLFLSEQYPY